jgi:SAM-dependent methyltransferase
MARERRLSFGKVAALYDAARPSYPSELVEDVVGLTPAADRRRALEVGAGTGNATVLFGARGMVVHALEPSGEMAALAERNCAAYPDVTIERSDFESWDPRGARFGLVYAAQAWHWIAPEVRFVKARSVLDEGALLAAFWNRPDWDACALREEIDAAYVRAAPQLLSEALMRPGSTRAVDAWGHWIDEIDATPGFEDPEVRGYPWHQEYKTADYVGLLRTHSDHLMLDREHAEQLYERISAAIDQAGGKLALRYVARLCLARAT